MPGFSRTVTKETDSSMALWRHYNKAWLNKAFCIHDNKILCKCWIEMGNPVWELIKPSFYSTAVSILIYPLFIKSFIYLLNLHATLGRMFIY